MFDTLHDDLKKRGWESGTYRGFLRQVRGGFEWEVGVGRSGRLEVRWRYKDQTGDAPLPENAGQAELGDVMTGIYLRVHEKPDVSRVFGGGKKAVAAITPTPLRQSATDMASDADVGQGAMDL